MSYAYFREPTGKPYTGQDGKHAPNAILHHLGKTSSLGPDGKIRWTGFEVLRLNTALRSAFVVVGADKVELNEPDTHSILRQALAGVARKAPGQPLPPAAVVREANQVASAFYRKAPTPYVLVASLSLSRFPASRIAIRNCIIRPLKDRRRFPLPAVLESPAHRRVFADRLSTSRYRFVAVSTDARSSFEAADKALDALNLLRGIWSLFATFGDWSMGFGLPVRKPIGVIHTGPVYTLHRLDGSPAENDLYWYDPENVTERKLFEDGDKWQAIERQRRTAVRKITGLPHRRDVEDLLIRYARALDHVDGNLAFLQMWSMLEKITNTVVAKYDETIRRATWVFCDEDRPLVKDLLECVRNRRNQYVHSGGSGLNPDQVAYLVKSILDPHLIRLIRNPFQVGSLEEYSEYLALPKDRATLLKTKRRLTQALRALG